MRIARWLWFAVEKVSIIQWDHHVTGSIFFSDVLMEINKPFWVMLDGSLGTASRYGIEMLSSKAWGTHFPWGMLTYVGLLVGKNK